MQKLIEKLKADKLTFGAEITNRKMMWLEEEKKLEELKAKVKHLTLTHAPVQELDDVYEEISKQEIIVGRRKNEYELISENSVFEFSLPMEEILQRINEYKEKEKAYCDSILEEALQKKKEYLDLIRELENRVDFNRKDINVVNGLMAEVNGPKLPMPNLWSMYREKASPNSLSIPAIPIKHKEAWG
ncbi:hypothetical protein BK126_15420 [Paenibacillus sp. FSL H7-0326]|uniref:hypothetical protein n=1 Tax=Paenibacillus sp. FSL H7-0326 TaxID=1921144 RepID=UPI00096E2CA3|nr:hypothetical protein [Paenibacillus sp. FSL H7-0326]OMC69154.1 hypothetical protein BK126_15420 [Paenibacillus sp. FSL H7-0326]